jgi:hypothetical protein
MRSEVRKTLKGLQAAGIAVDEIASKLGVTTSDLYEPPWDTPYQGLKTRSAFADA